MHLQPDTLLQGRYRVVRLIAQGGMGAVYEAVDTRLGSTVALKQTLMSDPALREAFEREARLLAALQHPALPVVSDHFDEDGGQFLVMQFIPGEDLATLLKARAAPFPTDQVLTWAGGILDALAYLHGRTPAIIHRDIKPQNLKVAPHGGVILLDFGLAKGVAAGQTDPNPSLFGYTPQYAPIEQIQGSGTDARSDLYALAATLAELLTGAPPPDALTRVAATVRGLPDPLRPVHEQNPNVPPHISEALQRSLALNPAMRHPSAASMRADLLPVGQPRHDPAPVAGRVTATPARQVAATGPTIALGAASTNGPAVAAAATSVVSPAPWWRRLPRSVLVIGALLATLLLTMICGALIVSGPSDVVPTPVSAAAGAGDPDVTLDPEGPGASRANPLPAGATVVIDGWKVDVSEQLRGAQAYERVRKANTNNKAPPAGKEYLLLHLHAVATAAAPYPISRGDVQVVGARDEAYAGYAAVPPKPSFGGDGVVDAGASFDGWAAYLVGIDERDLLVVVGSLITGDARFVALTPGARFAPDLALLELTPDQAGRDWRTPLGRDELVVTDDWELTLLELERGEVAWKRIVAGNQFNDPPPAGMEYVAAFVRVRRIADDDNPDLITDSYFTGAVGTQKVEQVPIVAPAPALSAQLFPGGTAEGWIVVTIPTDTPDVRLVFQNNTVFFEPDDFNTRFFAVE